MAIINENFLTVKKNYLFYNISQKVEKFERENPNIKVIKLGIGDVTLPISKIIINKMQEAAEELSQKESFRGYGPETGYDFLKEKIRENDYEKRNIKLDISEVFVSDGIASDISNILDVLSVDNKVAITDPVYPAYLDSNIMSGRENILLIPVNEENNFIPKIPEEKVDIIYLCFPNNPTGTVLNKEELKKWVDYAIKYNSIILYDAAYEAFIEDENIPHSIYEIEGAKNVAIEFKSYSKIAGFTGIRCGYTIIPKELYGYTTCKEAISLNELWTRRQTTKFNGVSYITQRGAEAIYEEAAQKQIKENIKYYKENSKIIKQGLEEIKLKAYGGIDAPYVWLKIPNEIKSWDFFDKLLLETGVVGTPGVGFGPSGEGYFRLTSFNSRENTIEAINRIKNNLKI